MAHRIPSRGEHSGGHARHGQSSTLGSGMIKATSSAAAGPWQRQPTGKPKAEAIHSWGHTAGSGGRNVITRRRR